MLRPLLEIAQPEPTRSELEDAFLKLIRRNRLPVPQMNVHVWGHRVDAYFPQHRLIVELDGWETHRIRAAFVDYFRPQGRRDPCRNRHPDGPFCDATPFIA